MGMNTLAPLAIDARVKRRVAFALLMGIVTTGIISFVLVSLNAGFSASFLPAWLRSWILAYLVVIPVILTIGPRLQAQIDRWIR